MKFIVSSTELLKGLMEISKAIPAKSALPILENFLFDLTGNILVVTASDSEITLRTEIEVDSTEAEGRIAVPARHIIELLKELPDQPVRIEVTSDSSIECRWSSGNSVLPFFPAEDYPEIKGTSEDAEKLSFKADKLAEGIGKTIYAAADDQIRPFMNGIFFDFDKDSTTLVASDSHKLICYTTPDAKAPEKCSFILHKKPASVLKSVITKDVENVEIAFDSSTVVFTIGKTTMVCRLIVGKYPKYRDVIPQNNSSILKIDRALLLNTVRRVSVCCNKGTNHIKISLKPGSIEITAQDLGFSIAAYEKIECDYNGDEMAIGFKSNFLSEILANMSCETVVMKFADPRRAALIVPSEEDAQSDNVCGILMPILVQ
ncbi:MAG: DNA polymerase III subunit beta [Bacteroidales bacterium]|uniref:DNA polymerase III subunit beta n=1 Tax=Candidatus Cryptobacteroides sp. TaxID=2952915 RepID=UPI002A9089BE|nr:DNA polymerase III subunit beta [Candidatus Cryptobacteroides sp.]MDD7135682.1 DNA polymerase III subunit beta [Bacteroidales bacterium]MDY5566573.1 DNA polymerase III subunit beta [Candidatus Cryptobacteroides sp.]